MKKSLLIIPFILITITATGMFVKSTIESYSLNKPTKIYPVKPLVDNTVSANAVSSTENKENKSTNNGSKDTKPNDIKSKETNAQVLNYQFPTKTPVRAKQSNDKYSVKVHIDTQKVEIYKNNTLIKIMECSTGLTEGDYDTPAGSFKINDYFGESFYSAKYGEGARYWVGFIGATYLFHSLPVDSKGDIIKEEAAKLGTPASHGCIRLIPNDAFWFYENIPKGSDVEIGD
jgi:lipoprotein-anchoring transpeptidase ErfK/SrfK